jgi:excisionase family DNA binding protein|tara:strand:- start:583 stop:819 length:237 start_codon:yes stop_codon:yes gene_type:complete
MEELDIHVHSISEQLNRIEEKIDNRLNKTWLSITDVTKVVGISRSSINRAISLGQLKSVKSGGKRMIRKEWVDKWLMG